MKELSLFSGAGGGLLATKHLLKWETIGYVEFNDYCQRIIRQRIEDGYLDNAPIFGDIRAFISEGYARAYQGMVDVVTAGFPCQPFSAAARGRNKSGAGLYSTINTIRIIKPPFVFLENVKRQPIDAAAGMLEQMGYTTRCRRLSAADLGADHVRKRYWLLAYADNKGELLRSLNAEMAELPKLQNGVWRSEPPKSRVADGVAAGMEQLATTGNGQVPIVAATAWKLLSEGI